MGFRVPRRRPVRITVAAAAVLIGMPAGCGSAAPELLDGPARDGLHAKVDSLRSALGNRTQALAAVERFRAEVKRLRESGELATGDADVLLAHADQIERRIRAESPAPRPTPVVVVGPPKDEAKDDAPDTGKDQPEDEVKGKAKGKDKKGARR